MLQEDEELTVGRSCN